MFTESRTCSAFPVKCCVTSAICSMKSATCFAIPATCFKNLATCNATFAACCANPAKCRRMCVWCWGKHVDSGGIFHVGSRDQVRSALELASPARITLSGAAGDQRAGILYTRRASRLGYGKWSIGLVTPHSQAMVGTLRQTNRTHRRGGKTMTAIMSIMLQRFSISSCQGIPHTPCQTKPSILLLSTSLRHRHASMIFMSPPPSDTASGRLVC
jgi:hypothetical protein